MQALGTSNDFGGTCGPITYNPIVNDQCAKPVFYYDFQLGGVWAMVGVVQVQATEVELIALCLCTGRGELEDARSGGHWRAKVLAEGKLHSTTAVISPSLCCVY